MQMWGIMVFQMNDEGCGTAEHGNLHVLAVLAVSFGIT